MQTIGEKRVRVDFNSEAKDDVDLLKKSGAELINSIEGDDLFSVVVKKAEEARKIMEKCMYKDGSIQEFQRIKDKSIQLLVKIELGRTREAAFDAETAIMYGVKAMYFSDQYE